MLYNWKFGDFTPNVLYKRDTFHVYANPGTYVLDFSDWNTCNTAYSTDTIVINPLNSINSFGPEKNAISIFPNPAASNSFFILHYTAEGEGKIKLLLYNSMGEIVSVTNNILHMGENQLKILLNGIKPGVYFASIQTNGGRRTFRLIINNQ